MTRRDLMRAAAFAATGSGAAAQQTAGPAADRLVLLGTKGGPAIRAYAPSPSANLLVIGGESFVIDAGYGVTMKLVEAGVALDRLRHIFITHHHSDHNLELGNLVYNAWAVGLRTPIIVHGPPGIDELMAGFFATNRFDIELRIADEGRPDLRALTEIRTYSEGVVFESSMVKVTALANIHPPLEHSYALKFALSGKTIVFSGDTAYFPPLADFARGADILVHEVMYGPGIEALAKRNPNAARLVEHLKASHTLAEDVGRIASAAGVGHLVVNHFVPADDKSLTDEVWAQAIRTTYQGKLTIGRDGLSIPL